MFLTIFLHFRQFAHRRGIISSATPCNHPHHHRLVKRGGKNNLNLNGGPLRYRRILKVLGYASTIWIFAPLWRSSEHCVNLICVSIKIFLFQFSQLLISLSWNLEVIWKDRWYVFVFIMPIVNLLIPDEYRNWQQFGHKQKRFEPRSM